MGGNAQPSAAGAKRSHAAISRPEPQAFDPAMLEAAKAGTATWSTDAAQQSAQPAAGQGPWMPPTGGTMGGMPPPAPTPAATEIPGALP